MPHHPHLPELRATAPAMPMARLVPHPNLKIQGYHQVTKMKLKNGANGISPPLSVSFWLFLSVLFVLHVWLKRRSQQNMTITSKVYHCCPWGALHVPADEQLKSSFLYKYGVTIAVRTRRGLLTLWSNLCQIVENHQQCPNLYNSENIEQKHRKTQSDGLESEPLVFSKKCLNSCAATTRRCALSKSSNRVVTWAQKHCMLNLDLWRQCRASNREKEHEQAAGGQAETRDGGGACMTLPF